MRTVWKYESPNPYGPNVKTIQMPKGARVVHWAAQGTTPTLWADVDPAAELTERRFAVIGSGFTIDEGWEHRGTILSGVMVWHLYEFVGDR